MLAVAWLVIVNRTKPSATYPTWSLYGLESSPVLPSEGSVLISGVSCHNQTDARIHGQLITGGVFLGPG